MERFDWAEEDIESVLTPILSRAELVDPKLTVTASRDPDDDHILACALEAKADAIVSGDKDLADLGSFEGISILTPRQFLDRLASEEAVKPNPNAV